MGDPTEPMLIAECRALFSYDPDTGKIFRRVKMNRHKPGSECGVKRHDYHYVGYQGRRVLAHRIAWALHYGEWPAQPIDHINHDRFDNRISNLRLASVAENNRNRPRQSNNSTGFKGVTLHKGTGKFQAKIAADKIVYSLGYFKTAEAAFAAYAQKAVELHGDFSCIAAPPAGDER